MGEGFAQFPSFSTVTNVAQRTVTGPLTLAADGAWRIDDHLAGALVLGVAARLMEPASLDLVGHIGTWFENGIYGADVWARDGADLSSVEVQLTATLAQVVQVAEPRDAPVTP